MGAEEGLRRSTRAKEQVKSYAAQQAGSEDSAARSKPASKGKKKRAAKDANDNDVEVYDADGDFVMTGKSKKKAKKSSEVKGGDETREDGSSKKGPSLFFEGAGPTPGDSHWHADGAERRIATSKRNVKKLAPGKQETRLRS